MAIRSWNSRRAIAANSIFLPKGRSYTCQKMTDSSKLGHKIFGENFRFNAIAGIIKQNIRFRSKIDIESGSSILLINRKNDFIVDIPHMKENYNILNLPQDLTAVKRIETDSQGWFDLASIREIQWRSIKIGPFKTEEEGQYYTNSVGLILNYGESHELLVWLPRLQHYGTWDSSHDELHIFPNQT